MDGRKIVIQTYINLVKKGDMLLEDIPKRYQSEVRIAFISEENNQKKGG